MSVRHVHIKYCLQNNLKLYHFLKLFGKRLFVNSVKVFPLNIKSINPIQKNTHITESFASTQKRLTFMFLFLTNALISFGMWFTLKLSK